MNAVEAGAQTVETKPRKILTFADIESAKDEAYAEVEVPEWKGYVRLGSLSAGEMIDFASKNEGPEKKTAGLRLVMNSLVDENGNRIGGPHLLAKLRQKNSAVVTRLVDDIALLNGMGAKGVDVSARVRQIKGNPEKLEALVSELRTLAEALEAAGVDEKALKAVIEKPRVEAKNA